MTALAESTKDLSSIPEDPAARVWFLLRHLKVRLLFIEAAVQADTASAVARLSPLTIEQTPAAGAMVFARLVELSGAFAPTATRATAEMLEKELKGLIADDIWMNGLSRRVSSEPALMNYRRSFTGTLQADRIAKRRSLGLDDEQIKRSFSIEPPLPPPLENLERGKVLALRGPIGSGKSDFAARWLQSTSETGATALESPLPAWIRAEDLNEPLARHIFALTGISNAADRFKLDLVIDGLDERQGGSLFTELQAFVTRYPNARILVTTREGEPIPDGIETHTVSALDIDVAIDLICSVADLSNADIGFGWSEEYRETIRRPLFALIAARHYATTRAAGRVELITVAAETALGGRPLEDAFEHIAVLLTRSGRAIPATSLARSELPSYMATGLLTYSANRVRFALPIFEQWFASQAILRGRVPIEEITSSLAEFARWRWVLAIAIATGTYEVISPILDKVVRWNPGAASWLLQESRSSNLSTSDFPLHDSPHELAESLWDSTSAWISSLGPLGVFASPLNLHPSPREGELADVHLSVSTENERVTMLWLAPHTSTEPPILSMPPDDWQRRPWMMKSSDLSGETWNWQRSLELVSDERLVNVLTQHSVLAALIPGGVIEDEYRRWAAAEILRLAPFIPVEVTLQRAPGKLQEARGRALANNGIYRDKNLFVTVDFLDELEMAVARGEGELLEDIWPCPELLDPSLHNLSPQSHEIVSARVKAAYEAAAHAYEAIRQILLPRFGKILGHAATYPASLLAAVGSAEEADSIMYGHLPFSYWFRPALAPAGDQLLTVEVSNTDSFLASLPWENGVASSRPLGRDQLANSFKLENWVSAGLDYSFFGRRPATQVAVQWIVEDLNKLGWPQKRAGRTELK